MTKLNPPKPYTVTATIPSVYLSELNGCNVYLKLENTQPGGSFKSRGLGQYIAKEVAKLGPRDSAHIFSSSGGNAGLAAAHAARALGLPCTVVVPKTTKPGMVERISKTGALVQVFGEHWGMADAYLKEKLIPELPPTVRGVYVHPFDHPEIWDGHATLVDELANQLPVQPDAVVLSVGGGGLYNGTVLGLKRNNWSNTLILAVETQGAESFYLSVKAGKNIIMDKMNSIATSLQAPFVTKETLEFGLGAHPTKNVLVTDREAARSCVEFAQDHKFIVEAACGASLSLAYDGKLKDLVPNLTEDSNVVIVVCGGTSANLQTLDEYAKTYSL
jgi:L-serine/L-threonine ammonia-lyase